MSVADLVRSGTRSIEAFAEKLVGEPLWSHQADFARSDARVRVMCAGRQVGKSRLLAVEALWQAFTSPGSFTLLISAGDAASLRLLEECSALCRRGLLSGSVVDDQRHELVLSNGSRIRSVPASSAQIRGWAVDLLVIDEAGFVDEQIWRAAEPATIARESRIILSSSPWGTAEHFFRRLWTDGTAHPTAKLRAWHWPSITSPLISQDRLDEIAGREAPDYYRREYLAEWTDAAGGYFTTAELDSAVADYALTERPANVCGALGVDWGQADANALVLVAALDDGSTTPRFYLPLVEAHYTMSYTLFIDRILDLAATADLAVIASETNGVGQYPTQRLWEQALTTDLRTRPRIVPVTTTARYKASGFGMIKLLLQEGRLILPNHPDLRRQLGALTYQQTEAGQMRISVPEARGHDDLAMALLQATSTIDTRMEFSKPIIRTTTSGTVLHTAQGVQIPRRPRSMPEPALYRNAWRGQEKGDGW